MSERQASGRSQGGSGGGVGEALGGGEAGDLTRFRIAAAAADLGEDGGHPGLFVAELPVLGDEDLHHLR